MKKRFVELMIAAIMLHMIHPTVFADASDVSFTVKGELYVTTMNEPEPYINKEDRTMVPIRFFANALGVSNDNEHIKWNLETKTAVIIKEEIEISVTIGQRYIVVNGTIMPMDTAAELKDGRTFIPVRFIAEALGAKVVWDGANKTVHIMDDPGDEVFKREKLYEVTSSLFYEVDNGVLAFKDGDPFIGEPYEGYVMNTDLNPNINQQIYDVTKVLIDDNHYVDVRNFFDYDSTSKDARAWIKFARGELYAIKNNTFFHFMFYENDPYNAKEDWMYDGFSESVVISMRLTTLKTEEDINKFSISFYENKLRGSLVALFGGENGINIYNFVFQEYENMRINGVEFYKDIRKTKVFKNIRVDFGNDGHQYFHFSFLGR